MHRMESDFVPALLAASEGKLAGHKLEWNAGPSVCVVLASAGYPGAYETGKEIRGLQMAEAKGATVFHAGTRMVTRPPGDFRRPRAGSDGVRGRTCLPPSPQRTKACATSNSKGCTTATISGAKASDEAGINRRHQGTIFMSGDVAQMDRAAAS